MATERHKKAMADMKAKIATRPYGFRVDLYLEKLEKLGAWKQACRESGTKYRQATARWASDAEFAEKEQALCKVDLESSRKKLFLDVLQKNYGNVSKSLEQTGLPRKVLDRWDRDKKFAARKAKVFEGIVDLMNEVSVRLAVGDNPPALADAKHLRWKLPKVDKRWVDDPKRVEVGFTSTPEELDAEILGLLGAEIAEIA